MIGKVAGQYGVDALTKAKVKRAYIDGARGESDEASFSSFAVELARVSAELKNVPDVRQDLIDDLKKKVEAGEYKPPLDKVAYNLFMAGILDNGERE